ncbi:hypothetical protein [Polystyrenella longa]|uniref:hypothetical protein n=1 Tax=Polystyrenella longa TaxID=2528007 RepID=UPI0011A79B5E|nr:hypothetical protein [Polystyrenella longa]
MTARTANIIAMICGTISIIAITYALYKLGSEAIAAFSDTDASFAPTLTAAATIVVSVISVVVARHLENKANIRKEIREKKVPVYEDLICFMFKVLMAPKTGKKIPEAEIITFMSDFHQRSIVWASDEVLNAWIRFRGASAGDNNKEDSSSMFAYEELLRTIRADLGHKNENLEKGKLLSLFVNDIAKYLDKDGK